MRLFRRHQFLHRLEFRQLVRNGGVRQAVDRGRQPDAQRRQRLEHAVVQVAAQRLARLGEGALAPGEEEEMPLQEKVDRSEEHTSELQSLMRNSYAVFCLKKKKKRHTT